MIIVTALRTHASATKTEELVAGRVGMEAAFHFSPEWDGLGKTAVFEAGGIAKDVIVGDDPCIVPHECMIEGAELRVGIYGMSTDGTVVIPTVYALVGTVKKGADPSGDESYPPTPDVGEQAVAAASTALQAAAAAQEVAAEIQRRADAGEFDGAPGYTPVKGKDYFDGAPGKDGNDYVLTEADKVEIAEIAADLVDVPEGGGSADLTGYATEEWVKSGYQPKGNYLTEVPAGYAKTEDIPTKPSDIGAQPAGNYLTEVPAGYAKIEDIPAKPEDIGAQPAGSYLTAVPAGYATEEYVRNKIAEAELGGEEVDLSGYAQKSELPTKVSQLENDKGYLTEHQDISGKLDASALPAAINTALAQAKASGEFDGKDGSNGKDGVSATHSWNGTTLIVTSASGTSSADLKGDKGDKGDSIKGDAGADGVSPTVSVSKSGKVTTVSITDKNGTKTATINDGADGAAGSNGSNGKDGTSVTVKSVSESTADGGSNVVTFSDGKTLTVKNGSKGSTGAAGKDGSPGTDGINGADGYTPVRGKDYYTEADKAELTNYIATELAKRGQLQPEYADSIENCTDTTKLYVLPDGFIYAYMLTEVDNTPTYKNVIKTAQTSATDTTPLNSTGYEINKCFTSTAATEDASSFATQMSGGTNFITGFIPITGNEKFYFDKAYLFGFDSSRFYNWFYDANGSKLVALRPNQIKSGTAGDAVTMGANNNVVCLDVAKLKAISTFANLQYAKFARFSLQTDGSDPADAVITINEPITGGGGTTTSYAWVSTGHAFVPADYEDRIVKLERETADHEARLDALEEQAKPVRIIAPTKLTVLAGHELNVYTDNMLLCDNIKNYEVRWSFTGNLNGAAIVQEDCLRFPATITNAMTDTATLRVRDKATGDLIASATIAVEVITEQTLSGKNVIFIGDSLTEATYYPAEIQNNLSGGGITSLGTRSNYIYINDVGMRVPHEGRSGWSVANYLSAASYNGATNSFYNPNKAAFDFSYYMAQQGYAGVNAVCIGLGTNGVTSIAENVAGINTMIDSIHAYDANIRVFVALITPPAIQDGWRSVASTDEWKRQQLALVEAYISAFGKRTDNVYVVPWHVAIHRDYDFPRIEVAESARNPIVITRANNNVHPSVYGYLKMADMLYNILVSEIG
jgi:lysophospholipase L1-like esterase